MKFPLLLLGTLVASPALAADLLAPPLPVAYDWSGVYVGGQLGGAFSGSDQDPIRGDVALGAGFDDLDNLIAGGGGSFFHTEDDSVTGGLHLGYHYQTGPVVLGVVADIDLTDLSFVAGANSDAFAAGGALTRDIDYVGTGRLLAGYAVDRTLLYATGGFAYAGISSDIDLTGSFAGLGSSIDDDDTLFGYAVGAGAEYAITDQLSLGAQYLYTRFDDASTTARVASPFGPGNPDFFFETDDTLDFHRIEAKLSYHFR